MECQWCKKIHSNIKFCSKKCQQSFQREQTFIEYENTQVVPHTAFGSSRTRFLRSYFRTRLEYKCQICSISQWNNKEITLQIDHIDGNSDNNRIENIRLLCPNCHSQTDNFAGKNIGNENIGSKNLRKLKIYHQSLA